MAKKETELAVQSGAELAEFKELAGDMDGLVTVRKELLKIPRIKLTQKMSNVCGDLAKEGEFASEVLGVNYGETVTIIPLCIGESASFMEKGKNTATCWSKNLLANTDGVLCKDCPHGEYWNDWDSHTPECKTSIDIICLVKNATIDGAISLDPIEINFRKMNFKAGRSIVNMVTRDKYGVPFGSSYKLSSKMATKDIHTFAVISDVVEKAELDAGEVRVIIPIARDFLEMKKRGMVEVEAEIVEEAVDTDPPAAPTEECPL